MISDKLASWIKLCDDNGLCFTYFHTNSKYVNGRQVGIQYFCGDGFNVIIEKERFLVRYKKIDIENKTETLTYSDYFDISCIDEVVLKNIKELVGEK